MEITPNFVAVDRFNCQTCKCISFEAYSLTKNMSYQLDRDGDNYYVKKEVCDTDCV